jgi:Na+-translocating ferredoxin:NAD+ oxidoreductase RnfD subunit
MSPADRRIAALRRFAMGISTLTLVGHVWLGFEQSWAQVVVALATCYGVELVLEAADAWSTAREPRFRGGPVALADFLLPAHISALAIALLLYPGGRLAPIAFAATVAVCSKALLRAPVGASRRHVFNPSNFGIAVTLLAFPSVSISPPYHFTENVSGAGDWLVPAFVLCTGTFLNYRLTAKLPLIAAWLVAFAGQALFRSVVLGASLEGALVPMSGMAFLLFTFYMVTDPGTTPVRPRNQVAFGAGVAVAYCALISLHVVFTLFFALALVSTFRGAWLYAAATMRAREVREARPREPLVARPLLEPTGRRAR